MKVLRAAVMLGLSTPLVVLACGSDDPNLMQPGDGGAGGDGPSPAAGHAGVATSGSSSTPGGQSNAGESSVGGTTAEPGVGGTGAAGDSNEGGGADAGGAGGAPSVPVCGDATVEGTLLCFNEPVSMFVGEGTPTDIAIGEWDEATGLDLVVANNTGLAYFSNGGTGTFSTSTYVGNPVQILSAAQLDSGADLDLLLGQTSAGTSAAFGNGMGQIVSSEQPSYGGEGDLSNYFVADLLDSAPSQDFVVVCGGSLSVVATSGAQGEGFLANYDVITPGAPKDGVLAKLGTSQYLVYSADTNVYRAPVTYKTGQTPVDIGDSLPTKVGGTPGQLDVGDFNEDGFSDVAATLTDSGDLKVLFADGNAAGDFAVVADPDRFLTLTIGSTDNDKTQRDVKVGDFNGDGHADIAVSVEAKDAIAVFSGDGKGAFTGPELLSTGVGSGPTRLAVGDLNEDGVDDLAAVGATNHKAIVILSNP